MLEDKRRLALVRLQAMIAGMARREAMRALAEALDEERRRSALAQRSAGLLAAASAQAGTTSGAALAARLRFGSGVARLAQDAAAARSDALRQAVWQADQLAVAEARERRLGELERAARSALDAARERSAAMLAGAMARKLQSPPQTRLQASGQGLAVLPAGLSQAKDDAS
ncbi:MAG: hypothetical protein ABS49_06765 [Erythrobacter sp. SCN 62-14]|nr:MAG: hypothetical protein ABS49_06765 [Erythrobacter sp. SCN 62-14]